MSVDKRYRLALKWFRYLEGFLYIEFSSLGAKAIPTLTIGKDRDCYFDGEHNLIHIGLAHPNFDLANNEEELFAIIIFELGHESQHVHSTTSKDWQAGQTMCLNWACQELARTILKKPSVRLAKESDYDAFFQELRDAGTYVNKDAITSTIHSIMNILEDGRIENIRPQYHPGFAKNKKLVRGGQWERSDIREVGCSVDPSMLTDRDMLQITMSEIFSLAKVGYYSRGFLAVYGNTDVQRHVDSFIPEISKAVLAKTCRECMEQGTKIFKRLFEMIIKTCSMSAEDADAIEEMLRQFAEMLAEQIKAGNFSATPSSEQQGNGLPMQNVLGQTVLELKLTKEEYEKMKKELEENGEDDPNSSGLAVKITCEEADDDDADGSDGESGQDGASGSQSSDEKTDGSEQDGASEGGSSGTSGEDSEDSKQQGSASGSGSGESKEEDGEETQNGGSGTSSGSESEEKDSDNAGSSTAGQSGDEDADEQDAGESASGSEEESEAGNESSSSSSDSGDGDAGSQAGSDSTPGSDPKGETNGDSGSDTSFIEQNSKGTNNRTGNSGGNSSENTKSEEEILNELHESMEKAMKASKVDYGIAEADAKTNEEFKEAASKMKAVKPQPIDLKSVDEKYKGRVTFVEATREYTPKYRLPLELENKGRSLDKKIERLIRNKQEPDQRFRKSGTLDTRCIHMLPMGRIDVFKKRGEFVKPDVAGFLLVDNSGSMGSGPGSTRFAAWNAAAILEEGFKNHMALKIASFDASGSDVVTHAVVKEFDENVPANLSYNYREQSYPCGGNKDGYSIRVATAQLLARPEKDKILIVASDGFPCAYGGGEDGFADTKAAVEEARKAGIKTIGLYMYHDQCESDFAVFRSMYAPEIIFASLEEIEGDLTRVLQRYFS